MNASVLESPAVEEQLRSLTALVQRLQQEVGELRQENVGLRRQVSELRCEVGYWKSQHARAVERNTPLQAELDGANAEIRELKAERFGKSTEKQSASDRTNHLEDPNEPAAPKQKRGQQPGRPAPKRRDHSHLPVREEWIDLPGEAKVCACFGQPLADLECNEDGEQIEIETTVYRRVVRRKAWLFFGSPSGGEAAAIFYTLTATCRRLQIDPLAYLSDLFTRWPRCGPNDENSLDAFLPDRWLAAHPEAKLPMRKEESKQKAAKKRARHSHLRAALAKAERQGS